MAHLCVVGLSHRTASVEIRERAAFSEESLAEALRQAVGCAGVNEAMILSTCNRVELYAGLDEPTPVAALRQLFLSRPRVDAALAAHLYALDGTAALKHLFRVAASLDSMVLGEPQILGQVKSAYAIAQANGTVGPLLGRMLPRAFALAKRVRSETDVARSASSIASAAVDLAAQIFGDLAGKSVLLVGAGKMGHLSARHLSSAGIRELVVVNRTAERATQLAARLGGAAAAFSELDRLLTKVDIVLCSTGASEPIIHAERVEKAMRARKGRWLFFIDIAVPRDVDVAVGQIENVYLYDVDALEQVVVANRAGRARAAEAAEQMVEDEVRRFFSVEKAQGAVPTIKALREKFLAIARAEAERTLGRLSNVSDKERAHVAALAETIVNKLLHPPLTALKQEAGREEEELASAVRTLFDLPTDDAGSDALGETERDPVVEAARDAALVAPRKSGEGGGER